MPKPVTPSPRWLRFVRLAIDRMDDIERCLLPIKGKAEFGTDRIAVAATLWNLEAVAEAIKYIPREVRNRHRDFPWNEVLAMQNTFLDRDLVPDIDLVWSTAKHAVPKLRTQLHDMLLECATGRAARKRRGIGQAQQVELIAH